MQKSPTCNLQSQTYNYHVHSGGTVLGRTWQRSEGYRVVHSQPQKDHKFPDKRKDKGIVANANTQNGSKVRRAEEMIARRVHNLWKLMSIRWTPCWCSNSCNSFWTWKAKPEPSCWSGWLTFNLANIKLLDYQKEVKNGRVSTCMNAQFNLGIPLPRASISA